MERRNSDWIKNTDESVTGCQAQKAGKKTKVMLVVTASSIVAACVAVVVFMLFSKKKEEGESFPPIPIDAEATVYDHDKPATGKHRIDCEFVTKVEANQKSGKVKLHFKNPGKSNQYMVVQLQITDEEMEKVMGENGRTREEQTKLDKKGYDPKRERINLGESGTIPPGYKLDEMKLETLPNGKKLKKGDYNAIVALSFYDIETNAKSMIHTQTPVQLHVC